MGRNREFTPVFQRMLDEPAAMLAALQGDPAKFETDVVEAEANSFQAASALLDRRAVGYLLFDRAGNRLATEEPDWLPQFRAWSELASHADPRSVDGHLLSIAQHDEPAMFGYWQNFDEAERWNLPVTLRKEAGARGAARIAMFVKSTAEPLETAVSSFGLPPYQQRIVVALVRSGSLKDAARELGVSYVAAREAMAAAAERLHLPNATAVVRAVVATAFGVLPGDIEPYTQLSDLLGITERQAQLALLISGGMSRDAAADACGMRKSAVKKELQLLYAHLGVQNAAGMARLITEAQALRCIAREIDNAPGFLNPAIEPVRYTVRPNGGGLIAWSDYGPASGKPVLIVHSNWCCRAVPVPFLHELQKRGWRPIAIDRPGFGASHLGNSRPDDPFSQAIDDAARVLQSLKIERIPIIARCGAQFVHAFASAMPHLVGPVVLVSPTAQASQDGKRFGPVGAFKEAFYRSPRLVELFFRVISAQFTLERTEQLMRAISKGSPTDEALVQDAVFIRDRFRALRPFACGGYRGGIYEELIISHGGWDFQPIKGGSWSILQGDADVHSDFDEATGYWSRLLPDAHVRKVPGGGRFLPSSHPNEVVDELERLAGALCE